MYVVFAAAPTHVNITELSLMDFQIKNLIIILVILVLYMLFNLS